MKLRSSFFFSILLLMCLSGNSANGNAPVLLHGSDVLSINFRQDLRFVDSEEEVEELLSELGKPSPIFSFLKHKLKKNKKLTAALLAFPFPLGMVGMHRIYLGTAPYVPVVYIATIGGVFGILPFIDFCMILFEKDLERFSNNKKVFMWVE